MNLFCLAISLLLLACSKDAESNPSHGTGSRAKTESQALVVTPGRLHVSQAYKIRLAKEIRNLTSLDTSWGRILDSQWFDGKPHPTRYDIDSSGNVTLGTAKSDSFNSVGNVGFGTVSPTSRWTWGGEIEGWGYDRILTYYDNDSLWINPFISRAKCDSALNKSSYRYICKMIEEIRRCDTRGNP